MIIVIDTNALISEGFGDLPVFEELSVYADEVRAGLFLSEVVEAEYLGWLKRELVSRKDKIEGAFRKLPAEFSAVYNPDEFEDNQRGFEDKVKHRLETHINSGKIRRLNISESSARAAFNRSIERRPPCNSSGEEIRDAMIWESILELLKITGGPFVLISNDKKAFDNPILSEEISQLGLNYIRAARTKEFLEKYDVRISEQESMEISEKLDWSKLNRYLRGAFENDRNYAWDSAVDNLLSTYLDSVSMGYNLTSIVDISFTKITTRPMKENKSTYYIKFDSVVNIDVKSSRLILADPPFDIPKGWEDIPYKAPDGKIKCDKMEFNAIGEILFNPTNGNVDVAHFEPTTGIIVGKFSYLEKMEIYGMPKDLIVDPPKNADSKIDINDE